MDGQGSQGSPEETLALEKTAHYENNETISAEQRKRFGDAGISSEARELLWMSHRPQKTDEGDISAANKESIYENYASMMAKIELTDLDDSVKADLTSEADAFASSLTFGEREFQDVLVEVEVDKREKSIGKAQDGELGEAHTEFGVGTEKDAEAVVLQKDMEEDEALRTPENFQKLKSFYEQQGLSKEHFEEWLKASSLFPDMTEDQREAARQELLKDYTPVEKEVGKTSQEEEKRIDDLIEEVQKSADHFDNESFEDSDEGRALQGRVASIREMLTRFNEKHNGKPERYGKLALKIGGGITIAFVLFLLWELHKIHDLATKKK